jgi:UDP-N-acetylglucosamine 2-epimerase (non-hydrolysing)
MGQTGLSCLGQRTAGDETPAAPGPVARWHGARAAAPPGAVGGEEEPGIALVEALDYPDFTATLAASDLVITDSAGVQEEAPSLGKPVL